MDELTFEEAGQVSGGMTLVTRYLVTKAYEVADMAFQDIMGATWSGGEIGQISGYVDAP